MQLGEYDGRREGTGRDIPSDCKSCRLIPSGTKSVQRAFALFKLFLGEYKEKYRKH